jgi:hypothetical protein
MRRQPPQRALAEGQYEQALTLADTVTAYVPLQ